jgi:AcrR family transcriptional regulator
VAAAVGLTKAALYYYFPSKDALLEDLGLRSLQAQAQRLHDAVETTDSGPQALRSLIAETIRMNAQQMDDFRLSHLHPQLAPDALRVGPQQLARVRPLNELSYAGAASRLAAGPRGRAGVDGGGVAGCGSWTRRNPGGASAEHMSRLTRREDGIMPTSAEEKHFKTRLDELQKSHHKLG